MIPALLLTLALAPGLSHFETAAPILAQLADAGSTVYALGLEGGQEAHPWMRTLAEDHPGAFVAVKVAFAVTIVLAADWLAKRGRRGAARAAVWIVTGAGLILTGWNVYQATR